MNPERSRRGARKRDAETQADHPYQDRHRQQGPRSNNNDALQRKSRDQSVYREIGAEQQEYDPLDLHNFLDQNHQHFGPETVTAHAVIDHAQEQQQGEQAPVEARAHGDSASDGDANQSSQDWCLNQALGDPSDQYHTSDVCGSGDDHSDKGKDEGQQDKEEEYTTVEERNHQYRDSGIEGPGRFDVVCGRGISADRRPGNQYFRQIVGEYIASYSKAPDNRTKKSITMEIVARIQTSGRFLKEDDHTGRWSEVDDDTARFKVGQQLRYQMRSTNESL